MAQSASGKGGASSEFRETTWFWPRRLSERYCDLARVDFVCDTYSSVFVFCPNNPGESRGKLSTTLCMVNGVTGDASTSPGTVRNGAWSLGR